MTYKEFERHLQIIGLNKKDFAQKVDMNYISVTNWKQSNNIPKWVESWLYYYKKSKILDNLIENIKAYQTLNSLCMHDM